MLFTRFILIFAFFIIFSQQSRADPTTYYPSYSQTSCSLSPYGGPPPTVGLDPSACFNFLSNSYNVRFGTSVGLAVEYLYPYNCNGNNGTFCYEGWDVCGNDQFSSGCCTGVCERAVGWTGTLANPARPCNGSDTYNAATGLCNTSSIPSKNNGESCTGVGNPINIASANKYQIENDYQGAGDFPLEFQRTYNSDASAVGLGYGPNSGWRHSYERWIAGTTNSPSVVVNRSDGKAYNFNYYNGEWLPDADVNLQLIASSPIWLLTTEDGSIETYNRNGQLLSIQSRTGATQTLSYTNGLLSSVTHSNGRTLTFGYNSSQLLTSVTDAAGKQYQFGYSNSNLTSVTYPNNTIRAYVYNETANVAAGVTATNLLTGIIDENGNRYATFQYDAQNRAYATQHAGGVEKVTVAYNAYNSTVTDALGTVRTINLTTIQGVVKNTGSSQPGGSGCSASASTITYDTNGNLASTTDFNGNLSCSSYDQTRNLELYRAEGLPPGSSCPANLATFTPAAGSNARLIATQWNANYRLPSLITKSGQSISFNYDAFGNLLSKTITDTSSTASPQPSRTWTYTYNSLGQVLTEDGPRTDVSDITTYNYYSSASTTAGAMHQPGDLQSVKNALGHVTNYTNYDANGRLLSLTDPNGLVISLSYDLRGRLTSKTVGGNTTVYNYDPAGNLNKVTSPTGVTISYSYDAAHRLTDITDALGGRIHYTLDAMDNRIQEQIFNAAGTVIKTQSRVFDALSRLQKNIDAYNTTQSQYQYDANGNLIQIADAKGAVTQRTYDTLNRQSSNIDALNDITSYRHDGLDRLTEVTDAANHSTLYDYNGLGDLLSLNSPNTGLTLYQYDSGGNTIQKTDALNTVSNYSYDALNRLLGIDYPGTVADILNTYDIQPTIATKTPSWALPPGYQIGRLTVAQRGAQTSNFKYDIRGNLISMSALGLPNTASGSNIDYGYNAANQLTSVQYSQYRGIVYNFDAAGQVGSVVEFDSDPYHTLSTAGYTFSRKLAVNVNHLPFGSLTGLTYGNGLTLARSYDLNYRLTSQTVGTVQNLSYSYDPNGNLQAANDLITAANNQSFAYDPLNRLISATGPNNFAYTYDNVGNRTSDYKNNAETIYNYDPGSQKLLSQSGGLKSPVTIDNAGDAVFSRLNTYNYDPDQRLNSMQQGKNILGAYSYDSQGRRVAKTTGAGSTYFDYNPQGRLLDESGPGLSTDYVYLDGEPLARVDYNLNDTTGNVAGWNIAYYHNNQVATPIKTTDRLGNVSWSGQLDPFGTVLPINANITQNLRFPGQYYDAETNLLYNNQRYYDAQSGRYLQSDRIGLSGGINTYTYVDNNPLRYIDPLGLLGLWIEGSSPGEPGPHQSLGIGDPNGANQTYSFGVMAGQSPIGGTGSVYLDSNKGGSVNKYYDVPDSKLPAIKNELNRMLGIKGKYNLFTNNCRNFSNATQNYLADKYDLQSSPIPDRVPTEPGTLPGGSTGAPTTDTGVWILSPGPTN
jgi:RHS repeat-associated protein